MKRIELTGKVFGELTVLGYAEDRNWLCKCSCGKEVVVNGNNLRRGLSHSCGHDNPKAFKDITGQHFGDWEVLKYVGNEYWQCKCSCGTVRNVSGSHLRSGLTSSCGHNNPSGLIVKEPRNIEKKNTDYKIHTGDHFGEWEVLERIDSRYWQCRCSCGTVGRVSDWALKIGRSKSCGKCNIDDLVGKQIGEWKVIKYAGNSKFTCKCSCGEVRDVAKRDLVLGKSKCCGGPEHVIRNKLEGSRFGYLEVLEYIGAKKYRCKCDCGNITEVMACNLLAGTSKSCGCKQHNTVLDKPFIEAAITRYILDNSKRPTCKELADIIDINSGHLWKLLNKFDIVEQVDRSYTSSYEKEICDILIELNSNLSISTSNRKLLSGSKCDKQEVDIYIENKKLAIEFNGDYWHSSEFKPVNYHRDKTDACNDAGVHLLHIAEHEWLNDDIRSKLIDYMYMLVGDNVKKMYARKCNIGIVKKEIANKFMDENHLQGKCNYSVAIGLAYENELVSLMTFGKPRFNGKYQYELIRYCSKRRLCVTGGAQRIFKFFIDKYNPDSIISYCDRSKFSGCVYDKLGFVCDGVTSPNYVWVSGDCEGVLTRYQTQKSKLKRLGYGKYGDTEDEIMNNLGYMKVYDCGNLRFVWNRKQDS